MTALTPGSALAAQWRPLHDSLASFRADCTAFEHSMADLLEEMIDLEAELGNKARAMRDEKQTLADRAEEVCRRLREIDGAEAVQAEREAAAADWSERVRDLQEQLSTSEQARAAAEAHSAAHGGEAAEVGDLRQRLRTAENELARAALAAEGDAAWRQRVAEMTRERAALEGELELVRSRAAELQETLSEHKHELAQQRQDMGEELKQLRRLVERQAELLSQREAPREAPPSAAPAARKQAPLGADPVVQSVMAQFARLQQDVQRRRQNA